jgi:hypothetical protein
MDPVISALKHSFMITSFVFFMMLVVEYVNVQTRGGWASIFSTKRWRQYLLAALLGVIPGCLGAFTATTLFGHGIISFGALVTTMIATSGDEAFFMFAMIPREAVALTLVLFIVGMLGGYLVDRFKWSFGAEVPGGLHELPLHESGACHCFNARDIIVQFKQLSTHRLGLILGLLFILITLALGWVGPQEWDWKRITFFSGGLISLFIVSTVPEHFLKEHLWDHLVLRHVPRLFMWTALTLLVINLLKNEMDMANLVAENYWILLGIAVLVGMIPQSGPHFAFVALYVEGSLPISILLANSISQDGHGTLPLLANSKRTFVVLKILNLIWGFMLGGLGHGMGL